MQNRIQLAALQPAEFHADWQAAETIDCLQCGATIQQTWTLTDRTVVTE